MPYILKLWWEKHVCSGVKGETVTKSLLAEEYVKLKGENLQLVKFDIFPFFLCYFGYYVGFLDFWCFSDVIMGIWNLEPILIYLRFIIEIFEGGKKALW